jgi:adenine/guanine phosphoribosyltransferase-like PRPP-binding protein
MSPESFRKKMLKTSRAFVKLREELNVDAIAFTGSSGAAIGFTLAFLHQVPLIYVRKEDETCHGSMIESNGVGIQIKKYLIVDDFIGTGATVTRIITKIRIAAQERGAVRPKPVGVLCFDDAASNGDHDFGKTRLRVYAPCSSEC